MPNIIEDSKDRLWFTDDDTNDEVDLYFNNDVLEIDIEVEDFSLLSYIGNL